MALACRRTRRRRRVVVALSRCAAFLLAWQAARAEEIVVGQTLSLTGPSATIARDLLRGRQACADYVNAHGGISMSQVIPLPRDAGVPVVATFLAAMRDAPGERTYPELEGCMAPLLIAEVLRHKAAEPSREGILKAMRAAGRVDLGGFDVDLADRSRPGSRFTDIVYVGSDGRISR